MRVFHPPAPSSPDREAVGREFSRWSLTPPQRLSLERINRITHGRAPQLLEDLALAEIAYTRAKRELAVEAAKVGAVRIGGAPVYGISTLSLGAGAEKGLELARGRAIDKNLPWFHSAAFQWPLAITTFSSGVASFFLPLPSPLKDFLGIGALVCGVTGILLLRLLEKARRAIERELSSELGAALVESARSLAGGIPHMPRIDKYREN